MPKDPARNIDRYKIRGGQFNEFDFNRQQNDLSQEQEEQSEQGRSFPIPSEQAKAERIKKLLAKYGESVPGDQKIEEQLQKPAEPSKATTAKKPAKSTKPTKKANLSANAKSKASARSTNKQAAKSTSQKEGRKAAPRRSTTKTTTSTRGSSKQTAAKARSSKAKK